MKPPLVYAVDKVSVVWRAGIGEPADNSSGPAKDERIISRLAAIIAALVCMYQDDSVGSLKPSDAAWRTGQGVLAHSTLLIEVLLHPGMWHGRCPFLVGQRQTSRLG